jgi:hypothetical protein
MRFSLSPTAAVVIKLQLKLRRPPLLWVVEQTVGTEAERAPVLA